MHSANFPCDVRLGLTLWREPFGRYEIVKPMIARLELKPHFLSYQLERFSNDVRVRWHSEEDLEFMVYVP